MTKEMTCAHCGKLVDSLCAICWRCKNCKIDCNMHMKRVIDGVIGGKSTKK